ncbi:MAG: hypothetical protein QOD63_2208 [Actinomycetota bacterium]|jgi:hypothetical protein|nr:hypothetical protein [Actinomycetota bacterium]
MPDAPILTMTHPDVHGAEPELEPGQTTQAGFDAVWKAKGWVLVADAPATVAAPPAPPAPPTPAATVRTTPATPAGPSKES